MSVPHVSPPAAAHQVISSKHISLEELRFDNSFIRELPGDPEKRNDARQVRYLYHRTGSAYNYIDWIPK